MNHLSKLIEKHISGEKVLAFFILTSLVYIAMLTITIPKTMAFADGMKLLDIVPAGYDFNYVSELFNELGENGRAAYMSLQLPVDFIYPLLFAISYCLVLGYFLNKLNKLHTPLVFLCILPVIAGIFDYLENIWIVKLLNSYPDLTEATVNMANTFSVIKSISTSVYFVILITVLIIVGLQARNRKKQVQVSEVN